MITKIADYSCSENFKEFLKKIRKQHKKLILVMDNAKCHFAKMIKKFYKKYVIKVIPLPKYSPQLNPIELYWRSIKKWIANKEFFNKEQLKEVVKESLRQKCLIPNIYEYQVV